MSYKSKRWELAAPTLIKNFEKRGMEACYCENSKEALKKVLSLIPKGSSVTFGGSECKLRSNGMPVPLLRNGYSIFNGTKYR